MRRAVFAGSFAPIHLGHFEIIKRACGLFDELVVAVTQNKNKPNLMSVESRKNLLRLACDEFKNVKVVSFQGTLADFCKENDIGCIVKSVRNFTDFEYEHDMAEVNRKIFGLETLILFADSQYKYISSSLVREFVQYDKDISFLVPQGMENDIKEVFHVSQV